MTTTHERAPVLEGADESRYVEDFARYRFAARYVQGKAVIDIACGTGFGSSLLFHEGGAGKVIGYDLSPEALNAATSRYGGDEILFGLGNAERIPAPNRYFDVAVSLETFEHVNDPAALLGELRRVTKPSGLVIVSTPLNEREDRLRPENPFHVREYSGAEFEALIRPFFPQVQIFSQVTTYADDLAHLPRMVRGPWRRLTGAQGLHAVASDIVAGRDPHAAYQIAVCRGH